MGSVWGLHREGDEYQCPLMSVHATREAAIAAIPAGSEYFPGISSDDNWDLMDQEHWQAPNGDPWWSEQFRVKEWPVLSA